MALVLALELWNLAGIWVFDRGIVSLRVSGNGDVGANLLRPSDLLPSNAIAEATRKDGKLFLTGYADFAAYKKKQSAWSCELVQVSDRTLRCGSATLRRWKDGAIRILPAEAVRIALGRLKGDSAGISVSEMSDDRSREWWVHIPRGEPNSMPTHLTVAVDLATGAARGPFGR
jgi:hypothetical protein